MTVSQSFFLMPGWTRMRSTSRIARRALQQPRMRRRPDAFVDVDAFSSIIETALMFSRSVGDKRAVRHRRQPDVGVEPDLVRGMAGQHRPAARLRDVADQQARPAVLRPRRATASRSARSSSDGPSGGCATAASPARSGRRWRSRRRRKSSPWSRSRRISAPSPPAASWTEQVLGEFLGTRRRRSTPEMANTSDRCKGQPLAPRAEARLSCGVSRTLHARAEPEPSMVNRKLTAYRESGATAWQNLAHGARASITSA